MQARFNTMSKTLESTLRGIKQKRSRFKVIYLSLMSSYKNNYIDISCSQNPKPGKQACNGRLIVQIISL